MKIVARGNTWQVHFEDSEGARKRLSTDVRVDSSLQDRGKSLATLAGMDRIREHLLGDMPPSSRPDPGKARTLAFALRRHYNEHWSTKRTAKHKRFIVERIVRDIGYWPLTSITFSRLRDYGKEMQDAKLKPATINRRMSTIHTALTEAHNRGEMGDTPMPKFPHYTEDNLKERYLTQEEEESLLASMESLAAPADHDARYMLAMVPFLLDTGLRAGEAIVDGSQDLGDTIWLPHGTTKSGKGRSVPLTERARSMLAEILASPVHTQLQEARAKDADAPTRWMGNRFRASLKAAGIPTGRAGVTLHTLRHTCASRLVQAGVSLYVVKEWLGHSSITVTERYAHLAPKNLRGAVEALEVAQRAAKGGPSTEGNLIPPPVAQNGGGSPTKSKS